MWQCEILPENIKNLHLEVDISCLSLWKVVHPIESVATYQNYRTKVGRHPRTSKSVSPRSRWSRIWSIRVKRLNFASRSQLRPGSICNEHLKTRPPLAFPAPSLAVSLHILQALRLLAKLSHQRFNKAIFRGKLRESVCVCVCMCREKKPFWCPRYQQLQLANLYTPGLRFSPLSSGCQSLQDLLGVFGAPLCICEYLSFPSLLRLQKQAALGWIVLQRKNQKKEKKVAFNLTVTFFCFPPPPLLKANS